MPGRIIERKIKAEGRSQTDLASKLNVSPQELNAIIKGRRGIPLELSLKIDKELSLTEGFLSRLQLMNAINEIKRKSERLENPPKVRRILFWDTDFDKIDWGGCRKYVLDRIEMYGTREEIDEIHEYYGLQH